ncbi:MAG: class I SAM-dependent methyltransferase [Burkholderiales bacterium]
MALCIVLGAARVLAQSPGDYPTHSFSEADKWAHVFDEPDRDEWQKPAEIFQELDLKPNARVADLGAGTGYFSVRLARLLPHGKVYAVDVEPAMVQYVEARAKREGLHNVIGVQAGADDPQLPEKVDLVLLVDVYHHLEDRVRYFSALRTSLRPGGCVAIIDFRLDAPYGPPRAMRVGPEATVAEMTAAGFVVTAEHAFLPRQYFQIFRPAP